MATFGTTGYTFNYDLGTADSVVLGKYTLTEAGTITALRVAFYNSSTSSGGSFKLVIYDDDGTAGAPGTRLFLGSPIYCEADTYDLALDSTLNLPLLPGSYWLGAVLRDNYCVATAAATTGGTHGIYTASGAYTNPPSTLPTLTSSGTYTVEVLATYTPDLKRVVSAGLVAEYVGAWAKNGNAPGNNSDPTSTWQDLARSHHGALTGFSYTGTDGWKGAGTVSNPFALVSDRTGGRVSCTGAADLRSSTFSVEVWMNLTALDAANNQVVVDNCADDVANGGWWVYFAANYAYPTLGYRNGLGGYGYLNVQSGVDFRSGVHQAVWTCNGSNLISYKDGNYGTTDTAQGYTPRSANVNLSLMALTSAVYPFNGTLAVVRTYNRALTAAEVTQNYAAGPCAASLQDLSSLIAIGRF
jgi:hypothetical protein